MRKSVLAMLVTMSVLPAVAAEKPTCDAQLATAQKQTQILNAYLSGKSGELELTQAALHDAQAEIADLQKQLAAAKAALPASPTP